jgi:hypothetical protein
MTAMGPVLPRVLPLEAAEWRLLHHAYGPAGDTPGHLARLAAGDESAIEELWSSLCHQESVYPASIAAVPHLVRAARRDVPAKIRVHALVLVGSIRAWVGRSTLDEVSADLRAGYEAALPEALATIETALDGPVDPVDGVYLLQAAAALAGHLGAGRVLDGFATREFTCECPSCGGDVYVWPVEGRLGVAARDPVGEPSIPFVPVELAAPTPGHADTYAWLRREVERPGVGWLAPLLDGLFGRVPCPHCGARFALIDRLVEEREPG